MINMNIFSKFKLNFYKSLIEDKENTIAGNTWTHGIVCASLSLTHYTNKMVLVSLLHGIGKPISKKYKNEMNYENSSAVLAYTLLRDSIKTPKELIILLYIINHHRLMYKKEFNQFLWKLRDLKKDLKTFDYINRSSIGLIEQQKIPNESYKFKPQEDKNDKPNLWVYIGLPGSGKSTYYKKHHSYINRFNNDAMMLEICKKERLDTSNYQICWKYCFDNKLMTPEIVSEAQEKQLNLKEDLVIDNTNLSFNIRKRFTDHQKYYNIHYIVFLNSLNILRERKLERKKADGKFPPLNMMSLLFQLPFKNELGNNNISIKFILDNEEEISYK